MYTARSRVAADLIQSMDIPLTVYLPQLEISVHQRRIKHSSDPNTTQHSTVVKMLPVPASKPELSVQGKEINELMNQNIDENSKVKEQLIAISMLVASDIQCLRRMISEEQSHTQLPGFKQERDQLVNLNCSEHCCSLSVQASSENKHVTGLCNRCASLISDVSHDTWATLSLSSLESTRNSGSTLASLSQFAIGLLANQNSDENCGDVSIVYSRKLIECKLPQLSVPLLLSVLQHAHHITQMREAYTLLATALKQVLSDDIDMHMDTEKLILQAACEHFAQLNIPSPPRSSTLPDLSTSLCQILERLLLTNTTAFKLVETAANFNSSQAGADLTVFQHILTQLLTIYSTANSGPINDTIRATFDILTGICDLCTRKEDIHAGLSLDKIVHGIWRNPEFCQVVAKLATDLIPKIKNYNQQKISGTMKVQLTASEQILYAEELKRKDQVIKGELTHIQAAFWYLDLLVQDSLVYHEAQKVVCLLKSALHFESAYSTAKALADKVALRNAALSCTYDACQLVKKVHPGFRVMTFQLALELSFRMAVEDTNFPSKKCLDGILAAGMFNNLVHNRQFTFIHCFPVNEMFVSFSLYFYRISDVAQREYLKNLMSLTEGTLHIRNSLLKYQSFENAVSDHMRGHETDESLFKKREIMISSFAKEKGLTDDDISQLMTSYSMPRDSEGWLIPSKTLGPHLEIASLRGFCLDNSDHSPTIQLLIEPAKDGNGLLSFDDVFTILQLEQNEVFPIKFSLDPPSTTERFHPFNNLVCHPTKLKNTDYMDTLFQADYLLKFFSTGTEVSSNPPFPLRPTEQGLTKSLPEDLQKILRPTHLRGTTHISQHRSWIEVEEIQYGEEISEEVATYFIQAVKVVVCSRPLISGINGHHYDAIHSESGPDADFAADFTANYDKIAQHFLVFARLREQAKLQFMMQKIFEYLQTKKKTSESVHLAFTSELNRLRSLAPMKKSNKECTWVPATFTLCLKGNYGNLHNVYGGVSLNPSQKNYYTLPGNHVPNGGNGANWKNAYDNQVAPLMSLENIMPGGVYFAIKHQYRVPVDITETENIVCVVLGKQNDSISSNKTLVSPSDSKSCSLMTETETIRSEEGAVVSKSPWYESPELEVIPSIPGHSESSPTDLHDHQSDNIIPTSTGSTVPTTDRKATLQLKDATEYTNFGSKSDSNLEDADTANNAENITVTVSESQQSHSDDDSHKNESGIREYAERTLAALHSFSHFFRQSPINLAVFGNKMQNLGLLNTARDSSAINFHPNELVQEQVMNVIILQHIYRRQGFDLHAQSQ